MLSVEAKDLYDAMIINAEKGYSIRNQQGDLNLKKFKNALDASIDGDKLREVYEKVNRRRDFDFKIQDKHYTRHIVTVTFNYSYKEFNQVYGGLWVRQGYDYRKLQLKDNVCFDGDKLVAIQCTSTKSHKKGEKITSTKIEPVKNPIDLSEYSYFEYDCNNQCYVQSGTIPVVQDISQLRNYLYKNGFVCDGIRYVRYKRSSGSSRVGKCLFVNEAFAKRMQKWDKCGLNIKDGDEIDLAAYEAYISLPMSSIINKVDILPEQILLIDDYESEFEDEVISVSSQSDTLMAQSKKVKISNSIWDGQSLLDTHIFDNLGYGQYGMLLLRNRFFKSACFNTNIQKWFSDNNITKISQLKGRTLATDISQIKLITTPSSIKYLKFSTFEKWLANIDTEFGVVKHEKPTHFFNGRMVQTHYQLLNTLPLSYAEISELVKPSLDYIDAVRSDPDILRHHIKYPYNDDSEIKSLTSKNEIIFKLLGINNKFAHTKLYFDFRADLIKSMIDKLRSGKLLVRGNYSTLFGNGLEMLKACIGKFDGSSMLVDNEIRSTFFYYGETILGSRSPHITMGNIALFSNKRVDEYDTYFNLSKEIVCINSIGVNIQQRLNGCDFDSDSILLTNNEILVTAAQRIQKHFLVPTNEVDSSKTKRYYTSEQQADLDFKTSDNQIGAIVNLSQILNSLFWDRYNRGETIEENMELYCDICRLAVLSNVEIDRAKKEFTISPTNEIKLLKTKYAKEIGHIRPMFFKRVTEGNGYRLSNRINYKPFYTTMDYLQQILNSYNKRQKRLLNNTRTTVKLMDIVKFPNVQLDSLIRNTVYYKNRDRIIDLIRETRKTIKMMYIDYSTKTPDEKSYVRLQANQEKQMCINYVEALTRSEATMYLLLKSISENENRDISRFIFNILFGKPNIKFFTMIEQSKEPLAHLTEDKFGNIQLYDFLYLKTK